MDQKILILNMKFFFLGQFLYSSLKILWSLVLEDAYFRSVCFGLFDRKNFFLLLQV